MKKAHIHKLNRNFIPRSHISYEAERTRAEYLYAARYVFQPKQQERRV